MQRFTAMVISSVRPSVCLSHAAIVTKRIQLRSRGLHRQIAPPLRQPSFRPGKVQGNSERGRRCNELNNIRMAIPKLVPRVLAFEASTNGNNKGSSSEAWDKSRLSKYSQIVRVYDLLSTLSKTLIWQFFKVFLIIFKGSCCSLALLSCTQLCMYFNCIVFNAVSHCLGLVFYGQLLEQQWPYCPALLFFSLLLIVIYCGQINDDDDTQSSQRRHSGEIFVHIRLPSRHVKWSSKNRLWHCFSLTHKRRKHI